jgi:prepilin signal peptidase PulO-like enzyme (type II secretory pathway)
MAKPYCPDATRTYRENFIGFLSWRHVNRSRWGRKSLYLRFTVVAVFAALLVAGLTLTFLPHQAALFTILVAAAGAVFGGMLSLETFRYRCRTPSQRFWTLAGGLGLVFILGLICSPAGLSGNDASTDTDLFIWMAYVGAFMVFMVGGWCLSLRCMPPKDLWMTPYV